MELRGFLKRLSTAILFVLVMMGGLFGGQYPFVIIFAIITMICLWEFLSITLQETEGYGITTRKFIGLLLGLTPFGMLSLYKLELLQTADAYIIALAVLLFSLIFLAFIFELFTKSKSPITNVAILIMGMVYIGIPFALLDLIAFDKGDFQTAIIFGILIMTWSNDTGAYMIGSQIGKHQLLPRISPKKTWEGSIGGAICTVGLAFILSIYMEQLSLKNWLVLAGITIVFGSLGDLVESLLKRTYSVKDSGNLLPGHGGFLDRFDAFIFLIPFATAYLLWIR